MNSEELIEKLNKAKKDGYYECRFTQTIYDYKYSFSEQLKSGWEMERIDYPSNDENSNVSNPRVRFKCNKAFEDYMTIEIAIAKETERHADNLDYLYKEKLRLEGRDKTTE